MPVSRRRTRTTNYGGQNKLRVDGGADPDIESYLRFNVTGVTGPVVRARLKLSSTTGTIDGPTLRSTGNSWTEGTINWSNRPSRRQHRDRRSRHDRGQRRRSSTT